MTNLTRSDAALIQREATEALREVFARHGLEAPKGAHVRYTAIGLTVKIDAVLAAPEGETVNTHTPEAQGFLAVATMLGFPQGGGEALGATVRMQGEDWIFTGFKTRSPKRPAVFTRVKDGRTYIFPKSALRNLPGYDAAKDVW